MLKPSEDYPRMLFHRTCEPVVVQSRDEEDALGDGWSRRIWPAEAAADPEPEPDSQQEPEEEEEEAAPEAAPSHPHRRKLPKKKR
jgi:hypothetical protein